MPDVYLSLGSNIGDRELSLRQAVSELRELRETEVVKVSAAYETSPVGFSTPHQFLNCCVHLRTELGSGELLVACRRIEERVGRSDESMRVKYEDRVLDIDVVLFGALSVRKPELVLPHPRATRRLFVLVPLAEIAPGIVINGSPVEEWIEEVRSAHPEQVVEKFCSLEDEQLA